MKRKIFTSFTICFVMVFLFMAVACGSGDEVSTAETNQTIKTNKILEEIDRQVGMPNLLNFQQKKLMKMVYELCDKEDLICYAYIKSDYQGKLMFIGKCIGFGVPFSAQYTNPMKVIDPDHIPGHSYFNSEGIPVVIPQADPNGLSKIWASA